MSDQNSSIEAAFENTDRSNLRIVYDRIAFLRQKPLGLAGVVILSFIILIAIFAPLIAPYDPSTTNYYAQFQPPSLAHPFGTDNAGHDIFSQLIYGARPAIEIGLLSAAAVAFIGMNIGLAAGYFGGYVDDFLMRLADLAYGIPLTPFVIVLVVLWQPSIWILVLAIVLLLWRQTARVVRSQVLSLKEASFVKSAKAAGASNRRIIYRHLAPNILPLVFLYGSFAIGWSIITEASVSFLGFGNPDATTWGQMLQTAYQSQALARNDWWWFVLPGAAIMLTVISAFLIGRGYEELLNPELGDR